MTRRINPANKKFFLLLAMLKARNDEKKINYI
jgi:hypothetical protein